MVSLASGLNCLSVPISVDIYPTMRCQLNCKFCFVDKSLRMAQQNTDMDIKQLKKLLIECKEVGVAYISILGGEPFLYKHIRKTLQILSDLNIKTSITSNGITIPKYLEKIINNNINITFSLQSLNYKNKELMGVNANKVIRNIQKLRIPYKINSVYTLQTIKDFYNTIDFCVNNNVISYTVSCFNKRKDNSLEEKSFKDIKKMRIKLKQYVKFRGYNLNFRFAGCMQYVAYKNIGKIVLHEDNNFFVGCEAGKTKLDILPNGDAMACMMFEKNQFEVGNVFKKGIQQVWLYSSNLQYLRKYKTKDILCKKCIYKVFCNGGCPARNLSINSSLTSKRDDRCKRMN